MMNWMGRAEGKLEVVWAIADSGWGGDTFYMAGEGGEQMGNDDRSELKSSVLEMK
jgi:hypothetical protein